MHTHEPNENEHVDTSLGYEGTDVKVTGIVVFLTALAIFVAVTGALCILIGKVIDSQMAKGYTREYGAVTKWDHPVDPRGLGNLASNPKMQNEFAQLATRFPAPRLQTDDGYQEVADMHMREDLLLENYSRIEGGGKGEGTVRIPIERAMELIAAKGLPVAPSSAQSPMLAKDWVPMVKAPLTDGFARTGYEQDLAAKEAGFKERE
jgi:hypothetical protein